MEIKNNKIYLKDYLTDFDENDRLDLNRIKQEWSRGSRIMTKILIIWILSTFLAIGILVAFNKINLVAPVSTIAGGIAVFILLIIWVGKRRVRKLALDEKAGVKLKIEGILEKKETATSGGSNNAPQYFLHINGQRFWVDLKSFQEVVEGDNILFEYLLESEIVLRILKQN